MGYERTKPTYTEVIATDSGWVDAKTNELLVAIKDLKTKLTFGDLDTVAA